MICRKSLRSAAKKLAGANRWIRDIERHSSWIGKLETITHPELMMRSKGEREREEELRKRQKERGREGRIGGWEREKNDKCVTNRVIKFAMGLPVACIITSLAATGFEEFISLFFEIHPRMQTYKLLLRLHNLEKRFLPFWKHVANHKQQPLLFAVKISTFCFESTTLSFRTISEVPKAL